MKLLARLSVAALLFVSGPAMAGDFGGEMRPSLTPSDGFFVGLIGGYSTGDASFSSPLVPGSIEDSVDGWDGGLLVGYEFADDAAGFFTAFEIAGMLGGPDRTYELAPYSLTYGIDGHIDGRIRAGFRGESGVGFSGIVGASYNRVSAEASDGVDTASASDWQWGWLVGGGVDYMLTQRASIGAEYTYNELIEKTYDSVLTVGGHYHAWRLATRLKF